MREREERDFWTAVEGRVRLATGLDCRPHNPDAWYFPTLGVSMHESQLYATRADAVEHASEWIAVQRRKLMELEAALR